MTKKNTVYFSFSLLLLLVLVMPACEWAKKKTEGAVAEVKHELGMGNVLVLDADPKDVFDDAHVTGAVNVSIGDVEELAKGWNKKTPTVVYCSSSRCGASHQVAKKLKELGFEDVMVYSGGIHEWVKLSKENSAEFPLVGEAKQAFLKEKVEAGEHKAEEGIRAITAPELSKLLKEGSAAAPVEKA